MYSRLIVLSLLRAICRCAGFAKCTELYRLELGLCVKVKVGVRIRIRIRVRVNVRVKV